MEHVLLVIHLILALCIIALVLLQRSEGGGLGIGGSGGLGGFASAGATANALTRMTGICAGLFFCTSLVLGIMAGHHGQKASLLDQIGDMPVAAEEVSTPAEGVADEAAPEPAEEIPSAPVE